MTAYGSEELGQEVKKLGVARYFGKPFDMDEMLLAVSQLLPGFK
jgi:ActR/RegA family two-component response regulator